MNLSVIIACYNEADNIGAQLEALAEQQWAARWEIIIADNGSTDESLAVIASYEKCLPNLRVVDASARPGKSYALNVAIKTAIGDSLIFIDADDVVSEGWLSAMGKALAEHEVVVGPLETKKLNAAWASRIRSNPQRDGLIPYTYPPYLPHAAGCNLGMRRSVYEVVGQFDEAFIKLQDTDYTWRIQLAGKKIHFDPNTVVHYRYRVSIKELFRQARGYGEYNVLLYKRYRPLGMPKLSLKTGIKQWLNLLDHLPQARSCEERAYFLWRLGWRVGRLQGSLKHRVIAI